MLNKNPHAKAFNNHAPETPFAGAIIDHVTKYVGRPAFVLHETSSEMFHLDVHVVPPADGRDFWFLFTTGMSASKMQTPYGAPARQRAELSILLPAHWTFDRKRWEQEPRWFWPIAELKAAARLPHRNHSWFGWGHTFAPADEQALGPDTRLAAMMLLRSSSLPEKLHVVRSGGIEIDLWTLWPIYPEELHFKKEHGADALVDRLEDVGVSDVLDPTRASVVVEHGSENDAQPFDANTDTPGMKTNKMIISDVPGFETSIEPIPEGIDPMEFLKQQMDDCPLCREARARGEVPEIHTGAELMAKLPRRPKFLRRPRWRTMKRGR